MLRVGIIGVGFMGWIHWLAYKKNPQVKVVAICENDEKKLSGDWTAIKGNFGPPGEQVDLSDVATYSDAGEFFQHDLDLVDICLPPSLHCPIAVNAFDNQRHVFCEKPMALQLAECDEMLAAASSANRHLLIGHVLPFFPEYQFARETIASGKYGKLLGGQFKRVISDPTWVPNFYDPQSVGGPLLDLHVHDAHFIRAMFGMPNGVSSVGRRRGAVVEFCTTNYRFDSDVSVSSTMGVINQQGRPFTHGFEMHLENATLQFEFAACADNDDLMSLKVFHADGSVERPDLGDGDPVNAFIAEINEVVDCLQNDRRSSLLDGQLARDAIEICQMQDKAIV